MKKMILLASVISFAVSYHSAGQSRYPVAEGKKNVQSQPRYPVRNNPVSAPAQPRYPVPVNTPQAQPRYPVPVNNSQVQSRYPVPVSNPQAQPRYPVPVSNPQAQPRYPVPVNSSPVQSRHTVPVNSSPVQSRHTVPVNTGYGSIPHRVPQLIVPGYEPRPATNTVSFDLIARYSPVLHFHSDEGIQCCFPSSAEDAYPRARMGNTGEHRFPNRLNLLAPCYYESFSGSAGYSIRYWFWYNFNDFPQGPDVEGSHPGDWEYVQLFFYNNNTLYQVNFSNHTGARKKGPGQVYMTDNHVHVWVGNGSHANYESQNPPDIYCWGPWCDEVNGFGPVWTCINLVNVYKTTFGRDNYCGDWGDGDGVFGPPCRKFSD